MDMHAFAQIPITFVFLQILHGCHFESLKNSPRRISFKLSQVTRTICNFFLSFFFQSWFLFVFVFVVVVLFQLYWRYNKWQIGRKALRLFSHGRQVLYASSKIRNQLFERKRKRKSRRERRNRESQCLDFIVPSIARGHVRKNHIFKMFLYIAKHKSPNLRWKAGAPSSRHSTVKSQQQTTSKQSSNSKHTSIFTVYFYKCQNILILRHFHDVLSRKQSENSLPGWCWWWYY